MPLNLPIFKITKQEVNTMKLEIINNYRTELNEALGIVDDENPVMGVLIVDNAVEEVAVSTNIASLQDYFDIKDEFVVDKR